MKTEFVAIRTPDDLELPGLLFSPDTKTTKAVLFLHGMGNSGVFYSPEHIKTLAANLTDKGIAFLALNNRGAHSSQKIHLLDEESLITGKRYQGGTYYEKIIECVPDINGAAAFLQSQGFKKLAIIGESTGANKICVYHSRATKNLFSAYVLAGPGDDSGLFFSELGPKRFKKALSYARTAIRNDTPLRIMPKYTGMYPFSAQSALDILGPDEPYNTFPYFEMTTRRLGTKPLFGEYATIDKQLLVVYGEDDEFTYTAGGTQAALDILAKNTNAHAAATFLSIPGASHSFNGNNAGYAQTVADWLLGALA